MKPFRLLSLLIVMLLVIGWLTYAQFGNLVRKGIETGGPLVLGVPVNVDAIHMSPLGGKAEIDNMVIGNPEGFKTPHAFSLSSFKLDLEPKTLLGDTIHIRSLTISGADIICEGLAADNHRAIMEKLKGKSEPKDESDKKPKTDKKQKRFIIDSFSFSDAKMTVIIDGTEVTRIEFPTISLNEIGTKESGVTAAEALSQIYAAVMSETSKTITINTSDIKGLLQKRLKEFGINDVDQLLKEPSKALSNPETAEKLLDQLGSMLKAAPDRE